MDVATILDSFKEKIEDAVAMVHAMDAEEKLKAVQYWNAVSERLQDIVNHSVEDISALAFQMEGEKIPDYIDASQLVSLGMAPAFMTRYISDGNDSTQQIRRGKTYKHVNGHIILTDSMANLDILQSADIPHVTLEVDPGIAEQQVAVEEVEMRAEETLDVPVNEAEQQTNCGETVEKDPENNTSVETQAIQELVDGDDDDNDDDDDDDDDNHSGNTVHLMITANAQSSPRDILVQRRGNKGKKSEQSSKESDADGVQYECEYCHRTFSTPSQLTTHSWTHTKPYTCTDCQARFSTKGNLIVHRRRHSGERPYTCTSCDASFSTKGNLKRHVKSHSGEKPWQCTQCGSRFTEKKSLKVHMRRHTGERPYECSVCLKTFSQSSILQSHMAMHLNQRTHLCNQCGKSFRQKSQLRLHEQRHAGLRKYQCSLCAYKFLTKGDMERHKRVHTGERPFVCEECGKTFTRQQSLNEHRNRHWGLKPYQCKYCKRGFVEMSACYKHIKAHERSKSYVETSKQKVGSSVQENTTPSVGVESGKFMLTVHESSANIGGTEEQRPSGGRTIVIQKLQKTATDYYNSKNLPVSQPHLASDKDGQLKPSQKADSQVQTNIVQQNQIIHFTGVNLVANEPHFQE